jgi:hypothetical protein
MTSPDSRIAVLETEKKELERRVTNLEGNWRWIILAIGALAVRAAFQMLAGGISP